MLGVTTNIGRINKGDSAELETLVFDQNEVPVDPNTIVEVSFAVQKPDMSITPVIGDINIDGHGFLRWTDTSQVGPYRAIATFTLDSGEVRSSVLDFFVEDPLDPSPQNPTDIIVGQTWLRLQDAFDAVYGGPWLRDQMYSSFDQSTIAEFVPEVLFDINNQMPQTFFNLQEFTFPMPDGTMNPNMPLFIKGLMCRTIMHLVRSYIEIPNPANDPAPYEDRTKYWQAWMAYGKQEYDDYMMNLRLWKRQFLRLGHSALLVSSKSGRVWPGATYRSRNIGRFGY